MRTLGLAEVLTRSRHRCELLSLPRRAAPHRHRSLASAVRWSADLRLQHVLLRPMTEGDGVPAVCSGGGPSLRLVFAAYIYIVAEIRSYMQDRMRGCYPVLTIIQTIARFGQGCP